MPQYLPHDLPWREPLDFAANLDEPYYVLLYSAVQASYSGRYSYLACGLAERIEGSDFAALAKKLGHDQAVFDNAWFGYLGYGLKNSLEHYTHDQPGWLNLPDLCMMRFHHIYQFDHVERRLCSWSAMPAPGMTLKTAVSAQPVPPVLHFHSNMRNAEYLAKAADIIERIHAGAFYQANLTRKFGGRFAATPCPLSLFRALCRHSPAPYSALLRLGDVSVASSSPELFLHCDAGQHILTRPIKGTAPRFADTAQDRQSADSLRASGKDRAENLMIVDLMRNDLARTAVQGSVRAAPLFEVTSHATIHHLSSTITSNKAPGYSTLDAVKHCFPPGSMTGAPKIAAMECCSELEPQARGVYSGALGWFGGDGGCELSVVIRTLIVQGNRFEFQVGGGIVADSTPQQELDETIEKAKGILKTLQLLPMAIQNL